MEKDKSDKEVGRKQFTVRDFSLMCDWLQVPANLECVKGSDGKTKVGARYPNKKQAFAAMAVFINKNQNRGSDLTMIGTQGARNRYNNLMLKYKRTKMAMEGTGWGLTAADECAGIQTIEAKLEKMCHCFGRLDLIMEGQPEIDVAANLFNAGSVPNLDGTIPVDILTGADDVLDDEETFLEELEAIPTQGTSSVQPGTLPPRIPRVQVIDLEQERSQPPDVAQAPPTTPVGGSSTPVSQSFNVGGDDSGTDDGCLQSTTTVQPSPMHNKHKPNRFTSSKKRPQERNASLTGSFSSSMESLSEGKLQGNAIKEKALEAKLAAAEVDRALRAQNLQRQLDLDASKMRHEEKRLEHSAELEAKRLKHAHWAKERKIELQEKKAKVQSRIALMKVNRHRSPEEIEKLLALMENTMD